MKKTTKKLKSSSRSTKPISTKSKVVKTVIVKRKVSKRVVAKTSGAKSVAARSNRVSLELVKPDAKSVLVAGSFNEWQPEKSPLRPAGNGRWTSELTMNPGRYEYLFVVDGQWLADPNAKEAVQNPFGGTNSVLVVPN